MSQRNPFDELERFFERMSRQFDDSTGRWDWNQWSPRERSASMDLVEHDEEFVVTMDLPGFEKSEIDVQISDQTLHIDAEHSSEIDEAESNFIHHERSHKAVSRRVHFPDAVDADGVDATLSNGVLTVTVAKAEPSESGQRIEIE